MIGEILFYGGIIGLIAACGPAFVDMCSGGVGSDRREEIKLENHLRRKAAAEQLGRTTARLIWRRGQSLT
jgi:hypothetical protein